LGAAPSTVFSFDRDAGLLAESYPVFSAIPTIDPVLLFTPEAAPDFSYLGGIGLAALAED